MDLVTSKHFSNVCWFQINIPLVQQNKFHHFDIIKVRGKKQSLNTVSSKAETVFLTVQELSAHERKHIFCGAWLQMLFQ